MGRRILNDALRTIVNAEKRGFASAELKPISNVISSFLQIMKYRGNMYEFVSINLYFNCCPSRGIGFVQKVRQDIGYGAP